ncbi:MAG: DUF2075 domain-containing protein [Bacteroidales bacterium]|nr:DUF2075 domain-containing protein [Bacteroidales bacterium]MBR1782217.1 DUF2075 domain-containing protein [Bacteroidales bacterium]
MIVYSSTKSGFSKDIFDGVLTDKIENAFFTHLGRHTSENEVRSWNNSLQYMDRVLCDPAIPEDCGVSIEYQIPLTSKRIDFIISGIDKDDNSSIVIVELKQWKSAKITKKDGVVVTRFMHGEAETAHPSYQAWSYAATLKDYNTTVQDDKIDLHPCAFLHNYQEDNIINNPFYSYYLNLAPAFFKKDAQKLRNFIKKYINKGDDRDLLYKIENGHIRPSKQLSETLSSMLKGNSEFFLLDDQKVAYETALEISQHADGIKKQILIIEGGPGTGKSVLAINLLVEFTKRGLVTQYVSKNSAPRQVYTAKLTGSMRKSNIDNLFVGSGKFVETDSNTFDVLIVDEAHRLSMKSGMYQNLGDNQIKEIINASKLAIFLVDNNQRVTMQDIGGTAEIARYAASYKHAITHLKLESQFRCNGSDGYLSWLDNLLQIRETANIHLSSEDFDFQIFDDPNSLRKAINARNGNNRARLVAGYCWDWVSKSNPVLDDIIISEHGFSMKWNLNSYGQRWIIEPDSVNEIGCIHTCQGLELDYVGVIIGLDMRYENGKVVTDFHKHPGRDKAMQGLRQLYKVSPDAAKKKADELIKNTYRVLLSRGMKGCFVYFCDPGMAEYARSLMTSQKIKPETELIPNNVIRIEPQVSHEVKYVDFLPFYSIRAACGYFGNGEEVEELGWIRVDGMGKLNRNMFVVKACGNSMEPRIHNGDYCVFRANPAGSREGKIVLVQNHMSYDPEYGGSYAIKKYSSEKHYYSDGTWRHSDIILKPLNPEFTPIILSEDDSERFRVIGEFLGVL